MSVTTRTITLAVILMIASTSLSAQTPQIQVRLRTDADAFGMAYGPGQVGQVCAKLSQAANLVLLQIDPAGEAKMLFPFSSNVLHQVNPETPQCVSFRPGIEAARAQDHYEGYLAAIVTRKEIDVEALEIALGEFDTSHYESVGEALMDLALYTIPTAQRRDISLQGAKYFLLRHDR